MYPLRAITRSTCQNSRCARRTPRTINQQTPIAAATARATSRTMGWRIARPPANTNSANQATSLRSILARRELDCKLALGLVTILGIFHFLFFLRRPEENL